MWSASVFCNYLLNFLNKYLEGSIFLNNYYEGIAGLFATAVGASLYSKLGKRHAYIVAFTLALIGGILIYLLEAGTIDIPPSFLMTF